MEPGAKQEKKNRKSDSLLGLLNANGNNGKHGTMSLPEPDEMKPAAKKKKMSRHDSDGKHDKDSKPPPKPNSSEQDTAITAAPPVVDANAWRGVLERLPRCSAVEGLRETSHFKNAISASGGSGRNNGCLKHLLQELCALEKSLPTQPAIWLRFDEETPQFMRALITGPSGTPYAHGVFAFDIYVPDSYPLQSPQMHFLTTGGGKVRFGPNLYANGKVCLSLLGTWSGPAWKPAESTLLQVLVSIQGLILGVEHPHFLEPGHGGWGALLQGEVTIAIQAEEDQYREGTLQHAILGMLLFLNKSTPTTSNDHVLAPFKDILQSYFFHYKQPILHEAQTFVDRLLATDVKKGSVRQLATAKARTVLPSNMEKVLSRLKDEIGNVKLPEQDEAAWSAAEAKAASAADGKTVNARSAVAEAASRGEYILAGQLQSELHFQERHGVQAKIGTLRRTMEEAALAKDYITAGKAQRKLEYLEQHQPRLVSIQKRMFELAAKQDFVRAGHFQEQYNILMESGKGDDDANGDKIHSAKVATNTKEKMIGTASGTWSNSKTAEAFMQYLMPKGAGLPSHGHSDDYGDDYGDY